MHNLRSAAYEALMELVKNSPKVGRFISSPIGIRKHIKFNFTSFILNFIQNVCFLLLLGLLCYCSENYHGHP